MLSRGGDAPPVRTAQRWRPLRRQVRTAALSAAAAMPLQHREPAAGCFTLAAVGQEARWGSCPAAAALAAALRFVRA